MFSNSKQKEENTIISFLIFVCEFMITRHFSVVVKFGKSTLDVELDATQSVASFKQKLFELTGVAPDKQKRTRSLAPFVALHCRRR